MARRTTLEIDEKARRILRQWDTSERLAGRNPDRPGSYFDMEAADKAAGLTHLREGSITWAWWRCHFSAQRYG